MNKKIIYYISLLGFISFISACNPDDNSNENPTPVDNITGKVKKMKMINASNNQEYQFYYATSGKLDSIQIKDSANANNNHTLRYTINGNNISSKAYKNGVASEDSAILYTNGTHLDSIVNFISGSRLLKTYQYDGSGNLTSYKDFLNNTTATPVYTHYSNENLMHTYFTFNSAPNPFSADSIEYTYGSSINNLKASAFGLNIKGLLDVYGYQITNSNNLATNILQKTVQDFQGITITTQNTDITYQMDTQNRVISDVRNTTINFGGSQVQTSTTYLFEYY